ncbi:glutamate-5-semialdehyde dehydrogenase [Facklamia sp. P9177]|uniref:glutamate-5-semialdehyde dehydrogenase n=1 Tax=Facklamia sp. P9177 TaxID=3421945 RepID=UPI003D175945
MATSIELLTIGKRAKESFEKLRKLSSQARNQALLAMAQSLEEKQESILEQNIQDVENARADGMVAAMIERLTLDEKRFASMVAGIRKIAQLADPLANTRKQWVNELGLRISQRPVPLGVIGIIYESRPDVTANASGLCLKAGNAVILRGGKEAIATNRAIVEAIQAGLEMAGLSRYCVQLITDPDRQLVTQLMQMNHYVDCLIPRGGAGLIQNVVKNATVPVIETGVGNVHIYIHEKADFKMAQTIVVNAKTQRPSVCNAVETIIVDEAFAKAYLPQIGNALFDANVQILGDEQTRDLLPYSEQVSEEDYETEFLDLVVAIKIVKNYDQAIDHISRFSTGHSEAIITQDYSVAQDFMNDVDSAAVYVNASTRFTDGEVFGFGGEIGISTQKLHARGPMGLEALTTYKYLIEGSGQIRE